MSVLPLRVAINVQLVQNQGVGGIQSGIIGLISALGRLEGPEEYVIIGPWQEPDWLGPYLGPNERLVRGPRPDWAVEVKPGVAERLKRLLGPLRPAARRAWRKVVGEPPAPPRTYWPEVPVSNGFYEGLGCDVIHFPWQEFTLCALPTIFNPHDLQHLHYPQFFAPERIAALESLFPAACRLAHTVVMHTQWAKDDIVKRYGLPEEKVQVIPWAPPTEAYAAPSPEALTQARRKYELPESFAFYPAMTWPHKNHLRLLEALATLRDREGLIVPLVCTGKQREPAWGRIDEKRGALNLEWQARFLGLVPPDDLRVIYRLAQFVIVPTLFEGAGIPVIEAFQEGVPVACSEVTSLPEEVGDAALLFDPWSVEAIAGAVRRMALDEELRAELVRKGRQRLGAFSWERTAKAYRAVYRRAARWPLTEEDRWLLSWDWLAYPDATMFSQEIG